MNTSTLPILPLVRCRYGRTGVTAFAIIIIPGHQGLPVLYCLRSPRWRYGHEFLAQLSTSLLCQNM